MDVSSTPDGDGPRDGEKARRRRSWLVAGGVALGLTLAGAGAGIGVSMAQTDGSTPAPATNAQAPDKPRGPHPGRGPGKGMGIHGEFVTRAPGGGFQTIATQRGEVTEVNESSVSVRSEDGFTRTYTVDDNTLVNAGNQGIGDVKKGDQVHVTAVVRDGKAAAVDVRDLTEMSQLRGRWRPRPPPPAGSDQPPAGA